MSFQINGVDNTNLGVALLAGAAGLYVLQQSLPQIAEISRNAFNQAHQWLTAERRAPNLWTQLKRNSVGALTGAGMATFILTGPLAPIIGALTGAGFTNIFDNLFRSEPAQRPTIQELAQQLHNAQQREQQKKIQEIAELEEKLAPLIQRYHQLQNNIDFQPHIQGHGNFGHQPQGNVNFQPNIPKAGNAQGAKGNIIREFLFGGGGEQALDLPVPQGNDFVRFYCPNAKALMQVYEQLNKQHGPKMALAAIIENCTPVQR
jgi:hypothetical protein